MRLIYLILSGVLMSACTSVPKKKYKSIFTDSYIEKTRKKINEPYKGPQTFHTRDSEGNILVTCYFTRFATYLGCFPNTRLLIDRKMGRKPASSPRKVMKVSKLTDLEVYELMNETKREWDKRKVKILEGAESPHFKTSDRKRLFWKDFASTVGFLRGLKFKNSQIFITKLKPVQDILMNVPIGKHGTLENLYDVKVEKAVIRKTD